MAGEGAAIIFLQRKGSVKKALWRILINVFVFDNGKHFRLDERKAGRLFILVKYDLGVLLSEIVPDQEIIRHFLGNHKVVFFPEPEEVTTAVSVEFKRLARVEAMAFLRAEQPQKPAKAPEFCRSLFNGIATVFVPIEVLILDIDPTRFIQLGQDNITDRDQHRFGGYGIRPVAFPKLFQHLCRKACRLQEMRLQHSFADGQGQKQTTGRVDAAVIQGRCWDIFRDSPVAIFGDLGL